MAEPVEAGAEGGAMPAQQGPDENAELKVKIKAAFNIFDKEEKQTCDVREIGTILRSLNIFPTEKQLQKWIHEIEEEEITGYIKYEKFEALAVRLLTVMTQAVSPPPPLPPSLRLSLPPSMFLYPLSPAPYPLQSPPPARLSRTPGPRPLQNPRP